MRSWRSAARRSCCGDMVSKIVASCYGEIFCLEPLTGNALWHNPLKGFGTGLVTMTTESSFSGTAPVLAEKRRRDEEAAASGATACV